MIYLALCILISVAILTVFRIFPKYQIHRNNAIVVSYFISFVLSYLNRETEIEISEIASQSWAIWSVTIGVTFYIGFQLFALSSNKIGMAITSVSSNTSVIIPVALALLFHSESASYFKILGIIIILTSFPLILRKEKTDKINWSFVYLPILLFLFTGINSSLISYGEKIGASFFKMNFMMMIFLSAFITGIIVLISDKNKARLNIKTTVASTVLGLLNFASTMMILKALEKIDDSIFFPIYNSGYIILSAIFGFLLFREKLLKINWIGISIALVGIILLTSGL